MSENPNSSIASSLLYRARNQDEDAWHRLYQLLSPLVRSWIRRAGVSEADGDDISQQVMDHLYRNLSGFKREQQTDTFTGWAWTVTKFRIRDYFAAQDPQPPGVGGSVARELLDQHPQEARESGIYDEESSAIQLTRSAVVLIRSEFEGNTWDAFWRTTVEREKPAEVAREMGMTVQAVYKAKSRVLRRVRQELAGILPECRDAD